MQGEWIKEKRKVYDFHARDIVNFSYSSHDLNLFAHTVTYDIPDAPAVQMLVVQVL